MKVKDRRMKLTNEYLSGIKFIKMNVLENFFYKKLDEVRKEV
jgi:hypothetical protein